MTQSKRDTLFGILGLALIVGLGWLVYAAVAALATYVRSLPEVLAASLIGAFTTVFVATATVMVGRYFERKRELDALFREKKTEIYDEFMAGYFGLMFSNSESSPTESPPDLVTFFRDFMRKLLLWSGPKPIIAFERWRDHLASQPPNARTMLLTGQFLKSIREDLGHSNKGIDDYFFATMLLRNAKLFRALAKQDPNVTFAKLVELEATLAAAEAERNPPAPV